MYEVGSRIRVITKPPANRNGNRELGQWPWINAMEQLCCGKEAIVESIPALGWVYTHIGGKQWWLHQSWIEAAVLPPLFVVAIGDGYPEAHVLRETAELRATALGGRVAELATLTELLP